jgi:hypothetical protein
MDYEWQEAGFFKTLERTQDSKRLRDTLDDLAKRTASLSGLSMGVLHVSTTMSHKDVSARQPLRGTRPSRG